MLVVDDQPLQRQLLAGLLVPLGFTLKEAASGRECLEIVQRDPPDMVLLDITMDDLDGWETAALLRQLMPPEKLPIVFVSANLFDHQPQHLVDMQCQGFVGKPIIESELLDALAHALQIEWVYDNTPRSLVMSQPEKNAAALAHPGAANLPELLREELGRLAQQGQAAALGESLRKALVAHPEHIITLRLLQELANRFDFQSLGIQLREPDHDRPI